LPQTATAACDPGKTSAYWSYEKFRQWVDAFCKGSAGFGVVAMCYQAIYLSGLVERRVFPSIVVILEEMIRLAVNHEFLIATLETLGPAVIGVLLSVAIGIPIGLLLGMSSRAERFTRLLIDIMRTLPGTALIPVFIVAIGQGHLMTLLLVVFVGVWPILYNTIYGVLSVDKIAIESALSCRVRGPALWWRVILPSAAPFIATGIRYATPVAVVIVISEELVLGVPRGIGGFLLLQQTDMIWRAEVIYAVLLMAGIFGFALNFFVDALCDRIVGWETKRSEQT